MELNSRMIDDRTTMESVLDFGFDESTGSTPSLRLLMLRFLCMDHTATLYSMGFVDASNFLSLLMPPGVFKRLLMYFSSFAAVSCL